jgi:hypothetical protein
MCLVIDACCLANVLNPADIFHPRFAPVFEWVFSGKGRMIYGGTKYKNELSRLSKYLGLVAELERKGKVVRVSDVEVDALAETLKADVGEAGFDDEHLIAIVIVSRCFIVATNDTRAKSYLKRRAFYSCRGLRRPKIYSSERNKDLCCDKHISPVCR